MSYKPGKGSVYYMINSRFQVKETTNTGSQKAADRIAAGNSFKTKQEASAFAYLVREGAKGKFTGFQRPTFIARILTWLVYLLLIAFVIALIAMVAEFVIWLFDLQIRLPRW